VNAFSFQPRRPRQRVIFRLDVLLRQRDLHQLIDHDAVLGMHADERAVLAGLAHGAKDRAVVGQQRARIGHEQLVTGDARIGEAAHLGDALLRHVGDDHVKGVVDRGLALGLAMPVVQRLERGPAARLDRKVDDACGAAIRGRARAGLERIRRSRAAKRQLKVRMRIDPARDHQFAGCVDLLVRVDREILADQGDR
jgi:hypothetical protein